MNRLGNLAALVLTLSASAFAYACGASDPSATADGGASDPDGGAPLPGADGSAPGADAGLPIVTCHATPRGDGPRKMLVARSRSKEPSGGYGTNGKLLEVLDVAADGALSRKGTVLEMSGPTNGFPSFTPDGALAVVPLGRGAGLATVAFDASGAATIVEPGFGKLSADHVTIDRTGSRVFVLDDNTESNGGGLYEMRLGCDGKLALVGEVVPSEKSRHLSLVNDTAVYFGAASGAPGDLHLLELPANGSQAKVTKSVASFGDTKALPPSVAVTADGAYAFVTDTGIEVGNRLAVVDLTTMANKQTIEVESPEAFVVSPFGNAWLLVQSDTVDAYVPATFDPTKAAPLTLGTKIATARKVELPTGPVVMKQGALKGTVFLIEVSGIRTLKFDAGGTLTDRGLFSMDVDKDLMNAPFQLGVQP